MDLAKYIRDVPDFPKKGILFKDITPLLGDAAAMKEAVRRLCEPFASAGVDVVAAVEARGFLFGVLAAQSLGAGFVPIRKPGKLPSKTVSQTYSLEYGTDTIQMHADAVRPGQKVLIIDDLLATGGTMSAACELVRKVGGSVAGVAFVVELDFLKGREKFAGTKVHSLLHFDGE
jgi:adenine phosphoribosyltransferase